MTVPYAAVIYDAQGQTWSYVTTEPLVFMREQITVRGDRWGCRAHHRPGRPLGTRS